MNEPQSPKHLLSELGILASFSIARKMPMDKIKEMRNKIKKLASTNVDSEELLRRAIAKDTAGALLTETIPGLIKPKISKKREDEDKKLMELTYFSSIVSKKLLEKKVDKHHLCYVINVLVNMLALDENDFDTFHRLFQKYKDGEIDSLKDEGGDNETSSFD